MMEPQPPPIDPAATLLGAIEPIAVEMWELEDRLRTFVSPQTEAAQQVIDHTLGSGGKRLRPALFFYLCKILGYRGEHLYPLAAVCEFVHAASLLHDDVVDSSSVRRQKPTPNSVWGDQQAVLVGDLLYSTASELMARTGQMEVVLAFARAIRMMSEGEILQLERAFDINTTIEDYFTIVRCKTASLIAACCKTAGLLAGAPRSTCDALEEFGTEIGIAFQIIDDVLDYAEPTAVTGKPALADIREGKITLPCIEVRPRFDAVPGGAAFRQALEKGIIEAQELAWLVDLIEEDDVLARLRGRARQHTDRAWAALNALPACELREHLQTLASALVERRF